MLLFVFVKSFRFVIGSLLVGSFMDGNWEEDKKTSFFRERRVKIASVYLTTRVQNKQIFFYPFFHMPYGS